MNIDFIKNFKKMDKNVILVGVAIIAIIITGGLIFAQSNNGFTIPNIFGISDSQVGNDTIKYINDNKLAQTTATLVGVSEESGLVKVRIKIGETEFDSYVTKDGKFLFPQAIDMKTPKTAVTANQDNGNVDSTPAPITKADSPMLEAYIVSRCPYGLQMQRAMADAVKSVPSLAQYMKVRYMGSVSSDGKTITAMHGEAEAKENLRQICIRDEQPAKYWSYSACQMQSGDTTGCETSTGVDSSKLSACMADPKRGVAFAQKDFALNSTYSIQGSPTLILNGGQVSEFDFGGRSADAVKTIICNGSTTEPSFCSTKLNTDQAASSFSVSYAGSGTSGSASSGTNGANCEPVQ